MSAGPSYDLSGCHRGDGGERAHYSTHEMRDPVIEHPAIFIGGSLHGQRTVIDIERHTYHDRKEIWDKHARAIGPQRNRLMQFLVLRGMDDSSREHLIAGQIALL